MGKFYVVKAEYLPEVFGKVIEAKRILQLKKEKSVSEVVKECGISRGTFYKYRDAVYNLEEDSQTRKAVIAMLITGGCGSLSQVITLLSSYKVNILAINQSIPVNGIHTLSFTLDLRLVDVPFDELIKKLDSLPMISNTQVVSIE